MLPVTAGWSIAIDGPHDSSFSLAIVNRGLRAALAAHPGITSSAGPPTPATTHVIRNMYPPQLDAGAPGLPLFFYFAWEDSRIPPAWADAFNRRFDGLLVPSVHVRDVVRRSGVAIPIAVVPYGIDAGLARGTESTAPAVPTRRGFRFLHVSTGFPRKGCDVLLRAFVREFSSREDVALIIKTLPQYDHPTARLVRRARWLHPRCPEIVHVDRDLDRDAMARLYASASCLVHPARAEGFGLPIAEAMLAHVPVIASAGSGHADFCTDATAWLVPCRPEPSRSPFVVEGAEWHEPDEGALRATMRQVFEGREPAKTRGRVARASAHLQTFTWERAAERAVQFLQAVQASDGTPLRAGMLTTWRERCGIAEYSRQLIDAVGDATIRWTILAPRRVGEPAISAGDGDDGRPIIRCWQDSWPTGIDDAVAQIRQLDLQFVHVQTHLNVWGATAARALASLAAEGRRLFVTFHSVRGASPDRATVDALSRLDRLLVHTDADRRHLATLGLDQTVTVLPQGYPAALDVPASDARARLGVAGGPVVGTFGFLRPHKGTLELIRAVSRLRRRYADIQLVAVCARYPSADSTAYHAQCVAEAERLALASHCHFITDFLEPRESLAALRGCDVIALPYHPSTDSSSASARTALASRRPVVTTAVPVFADVADAVLSVRRGSPRALAAGIERLLNDDLLREQLARGAARHLHEESWASVGRIYRRMLRGATMNVSDLQEPYPIAAS